MILIDSPITPYSKIPEIEAWIAELKEMEPSPEVEEALREAMDTLEFQQKNIETRQR